jgi:hypothetical protein
MIRKIVSNGRIGVSRGALDAAMALDIPHGGWMLNQDPAAGEPPPDQYRLQVMKTGSVAKCVERNVKEAEGTLILTFSDQLPDDALGARKSADKHHLPWLHINLDRTAEFEAAQSIHEWLKERKIQVVHVVGATCGKAGEEVNKTTTGLLEAVYYLGLIENNMAETYRSPPPQQEAPPESINEIVSRISADMTLKDRVIVANLGEAQLELLQPTLGRYILGQIEHWQKGHAHDFSLPELEEGVVDIEEAAAAIIKRLWVKLRETHRLRMVK